MKHNVDLNRISDFIRIIEFGNLSRAAEAMGERKAKLSRSLALLEEELGVQLVYRTTRQFQLTHAGQSFYQRCKLYISELDQAVMSLSSQDQGLSGTIRITAPEDIGMLKITSLVSEYSKQNPSVKFDLIYSNEVLDIVKLGIDIAVRVGHLKDSSMIQKKVGKVDFVLACSPKYLERIRIPGHPDQLEGLDLIGFSREKDMKWNLQSGTQKKSVKIKPAHSANNFITVRDLARSGHGVAFMPLSICEDQIRSGELVHILKAWGREGVPIQVAMPHQKNISKLVRNCFDFTVRKLSEAF